MSDIKVAANAGMGGSVLQRAETRGEFNVQPGVDLTFPIVREDRFWAQNIHLRVEAESIFGIGTGEHNRVDMLTGGGLEFKWFTDASSYGLSLTGGYARRVTLEGGDGLYLSSMGYVGGIERLLSIYFKATATQIEKELAITLTVGPRAEF